MADQALHPASQLHTDFRQLGGFARTGFPRHNHHLVVAHGVEDLLFFLTNRQVLRIIDRRPGGFAQQDSPCRLFNFLRHLLKDGLLGIRIFNLLHAVQATGEARLIAQHQAIKPCKELREGYFLLFCHSVIGQRTAGKNLF